MFHLNRNSGSVHRGPSDARNGPPGSGPWTSIQDEPRDVTFSSFRGAAIRFHSSLHRPTRTRPRFRRTERGSPTCRTRPEERRSTYSPFRAGDARAGLVGRRKGSRVGARRSRALLSPGDGGHGGEGLDGACLPRREAHDALRRTFPGGHDGPSQLRCVARRPEVSDDAPCARASGSAPHRIEPRG